VKKKIILVLIVAVLAGLALVACTHDTLTEPVPPSMEIDIAAIKAKISGNWGIAYGNSRITISEDGRYEASWDNATIINGQFTISHEDETHYRLTLTPERVRTISATQPEFCSPKFDDEQYNSSPSWAQQDVIINPSNKNRLGLVNHDGTVDWVSIWFDPEVLWLEDRIYKTTKQGYRVKEFCLNTIALFSTQITISAST